LPNVEQLEKYSDATNVHVLLSLFLSGEFQKPTIDVPDTIDKKKNTTWYILSYSDIHAVLLDVLVYSKSKFPTDADFQKYLEDYLLFIYLLDKLVTSSTFTDLSLQSKFLYQPLTDELKKLRIHDLFTKIRFEQLHLLMIDKLKGKGLPFVHPKVAKTVLPDIVIHTNYTNAQGLLDVSFHINKKYIVGVQIQDNQFRMFLNAGKKKDADKLLTAIENYNSKEGKQNWFSVGGNEAIKFEGKNKTEKYNFFKPGFHYKKFRIGNDETVDSILNLIVLVMEKYNAEYKDLGL
jgi:hypothetical protein